MTLGEESKTILMSVLRKRSDMVQRNIAAKLPACKRPGSLIQVSLSCCSLPRSIQTLRHCGRRSIYFGVLIPGECQRALAAGGMRALWCLGPSCLTNGHCSAARPCVHPALPMASPAGTGARAPQSPTSAPRRRPAPHAVLPVRRGAEDGGLSSQRVAGVAGVGDHVRVGEGVPQVPAVTPVGDVRGRIADDTCRRVQGGF